MQAEDRPAFDRILAELFGAIDKPLGESTREGFWKGLQKMSLIEFARVRDLLMDDFSAGNAPKRFGVPDIWEAKKRLRAAAPPTDDQPRWTGDDWDIRGNWRLMSRILRAVVNRQAYSPEQIRALVAFKNHWTEIMRAASKDGEVSLAEQSETWDLCMHDAHAEMAGVKAA